MILGRASIAMALALSAFGAWACGYCIEDKIALVYDHAVVTKALERKQHVAFFGLQGPVERSDERRVRAAAEAIRGVVKGSARFSREAAALSMAYDPEVLTNEALYQALARRLESGSLQPLPLRIIDAPAKLGAPGI